MESFSDLPEMAAIRWQCRRGMLELDMMLVLFFEKEYENLDREGKFAFVKLLSHTDQELYQWLIGREEPEFSSLKNMVEKIRYFK